MSKKRIAICGFNLESNRFAPTCSRPDFEENMWFRADIDFQARARDCGAGCTGCRNSGPACQRLRRDDGGDRPMIGYLTNPMPVLRVV